jgi:hypothetical protein
VCGCARGDICRVIIGSLLLCGLYRAALFMLIFMFEAAFVESWQRCPGLYSPRLASPCSPGSRTLSFWSRTMSFWKQLKGPPSRTLHQAPPAFGGAWFPQGQLDVLPPDFVNSSAPQLRHWSPSLLSVTALRHCRLSPTPAAGTTHLCDNLVN